MRAGRMGRTADAIASDWPFLMPSLTLATPSNNPVMGLTTSPYKPQPTPCAKPSAPFFSAPRIGASTKPEKPDATASLKLDAPDTRPSYLRVPVCVKVAVHDDHA